MQFEFRKYSRSFQPSLATSHGVWRDRQGILLRLTDEAGCSGIGEIAPLTWFGSETMAEAIAFCRSLPPKITAEAIFAIPDRLPACQFGFESAWESLRHSAPTSINALECSWLLPTGKAALQAWRSLWQPGCTFKWKIGVAPLADELTLFEQLLQELPQTTKLRLDANGGLAIAEAHQWLARCQRDLRVEFLEQPLPVDQFDVMVQLSQQYSTPIALDESVATLNQLEDCYQQGWRGVFVVKAAIAGSLKRLRQFCQYPGVDVVWSSVFETGVAQEFIVNRLIPSVPQQQRAIGFGVNHWFTDELNRLESEAIWQSL